ncbi:hypothetical protein BDK51DRAFT_33507 [Blyttiomyces helicus]|uniref:Uncharacterized protein n=1 Tax=Blyttiomyces helicus TaxID=388810 RepID=A0A4P9VV25_9FUNG|nr:hypothetical protein BDK51DRAFT_33507 [Blyttiomyces helicus]|eukprot:RKO83471.1 hypothetical protein BDK51DRAFT_33507 [Blyttiomyces helicus]
MSAVSLSAPTTNSTKLDNSARLGPNPMSARLGPKPSSSLYTSVRLGTPLVDVLRYLISRFTRENYTDALIAISLEMEEICREPNPHIHETIYEVPYDLDPLRLLKKVQRRMRRCAISRGHRVDVKFDKNTNSIICRVCPG